MFACNYNCFILNVTQRQCTCGYTRLVSVRCYFTRQIISSIFGNRQNFLTAYMAEMVIGYILFLEKWKRKPLILFINHTAHTTHVHHCLHVLRGGCNKRHNFFQFKRKRCLRIIKSFIVCFPQIPSNALGVFPNRLKVSLNQTHNKSNKRYSSKSKCESNLQ